MCREVGCQRRAHPESPYCDTHRRAILTAAFAQTSRETEEERGRFPPMAPAPSRRAPEYLPGLGRPATE